MLGEDGGDLLGALDGREVPRTTQLNEVRMGQLRSAKQVRTAASFQSRLWFEELLETTRLCLTALCS